METPCNRIRPGSSAGPYGYALIQSFDDLVRRLAAFAGWMSITTGASAVLNVKDKIVAGSRSNSHRYGVELEVVTHFPGHDMVGTRGVATNPERSDEFSLFVV
jgi:hypothetical protein